MDTRSNDDFLELLERFLNTQIVAFATPVYWQGVSTQMKCFIDRLSSYFRRTPYARKFDGKGYLVLCTFGRNDPSHGKWLTEPMKITVEVLRGNYLGDISVSVYEKGRIRQMPEVLKEAYQLGKDAVKKFNSLTRENKM